MKPKNDPVRVRVKSFGMLAEWIKDQSVALGTDRSLSGFCKLLAERSGMKLKEMILDPETNEVRPSVGILINGRIGHDLQQGLADGDEVTLFILGAGG